MLFDASDATDDALTAPFKTVPDSMFTLFRVMSGAQSDAEAAALDSIMDDIPTFKFAFVFFMVTSSWTLLSILTAVVSENMISTTSGQEKEILLMSEEEDRKRHVQEGACQLSLLAHLYTMFIVIAIKNNLELICFVPIFRLTRLLPPART